MLQREAPELMQLPSSAWLVARMPSHGRKLMWHNTLTGEATSKQPKGSDRVIRQSTAPLGVEGEDSGRR